VPTSPPPPPPPKTGGDKAGGTAKSKFDDDEKEHVRNAVTSAELTSDPALTEVLNNIVDNNKKLRYNKRLQSGKLDGRRLTAYKTSDRLFKLKAIKDKKYQFTFLIDTSGSMLSDDDNDEGITRIQMALEAVARTSKSLEDMNIRTSIFGMNNSFRLFKGFEQPLDDLKLVDDTYRAVIEYYEYDGSKVNNAGGTSEWVAYEQTVDYISKHSEPKVTNVVIIISDGAPGGSGDVTQVIVENGEEFVDREHDKDSNETLAKFWEKRSDILTFGLGIGRKATQVPTNRQINDIKKLPDVMGNLLTELML
jgi:hypothetical protein